MASRLINPAFNLKAFTNFASASAAPPAINALYLRKGEYDGMTRADVAASFASYAAGLQDRLALFFHGGLVSKTDGSKGASLQYDRFNKSCFPYFFIWESGFWEIVENDFPSIFGDTLFGSIFHNARNVVAAKLGVTSSPTPLAFLHEETLTKRDPMDAVALDDAKRKSFVITHEDLDAFTKALVADRNFLDAVSSVARSAANQPTAAREMLLAQMPTIKRTDNHRLNSAMVGAIVGAYHGGMTSPPRPGQQQMMLSLDLGGLMNAAIAFAHALWGVLVNVAKRYAAGRDHGMTCTIVEEILRVAYLSNFGSSMWEEMKTETSTAFGPDSSRFGGRAVIEELCSLVKSGTKPNMKVTLIGHSTGGVFIGNFLKEIDAALQAQGDTSFQFDVILMAPANTMTFFEQTYNSRVRALRWFSMTDAAEQQDLLISSDIGTDPNAPLFGRVYPRSLLYLISGALETFAPNIPLNAPHDLDTSDMPLFGMDRFFAQTGIFGTADYPAVDKARRYLAQSPKFMRVLSPTASGAAPGQQCTSIKHGNFPGNGPMCDSIDYMLSNGII